MKVFAISVLLLVSATFAFSGVVGFLTRETRNWDFIQAVGGMKVSMQEDHLLVDCDVSGVRKVTVEPTVVNSALGVRTVKHQRVGDTIRLRLVTSAIEKGITRSCKPIDLSAYPAGIYTVQYVDSDGTVHPLGKVTLEGKNDDE